MRPLPGSGRLGVTTVAWLFILSISPTLSGGTGGCTHPISISWCSKMASFRRFCLPLVLPLHQHAFNRDALLLELGFVLSVLPISRPGPALNAFNRDALLLDITSI